MNIVTLHTFDTEYSADSIEWCTHKEYSSYFVCGTYQLEETDGENVSNADANCRRKGRIYLFKFERKTAKLIELQRIETAAILDMKWLPIETTSATLAAATALGQVLIFEMQQEKLILLLTYTLDAAQPCLALSLDTKATDQQGECQLVVSDSKGSINVLNYAAADKPQLTPAHAWASHNFEAWICTFDKWHSQRIYSGGDDCLLHAYDMRTHERIFTNKSHLAGVTCLLSHAQHEYQLLTGSYDEKLRVFDTRALKQELHSLNLNGGIWRLKSHPKCSEMLLAACMYENFSIVEFAQNNSLQIKAIYNEHKSICYGADWCLDVDQNNKEFYMATCSFYDHKLCIAKLERIEYSSSNK